jgi:hypothetical protein
MKNDLLDVLEVVDVLARGCAKLAEAELRQNGTCEGQAGAAMIERARHALEHLRAECISRGEAA